MNTRDCIKQKIARKLLWSSLGIIGVGILVVSFFLILMTDSGSSKKSEAENTAINALQIKLGNPSSLKILRISTPDSVFINRMCPEYEVMDLSERFLEYSLNIMQDSQTGLNDAESKSYRCRMDRYAESSNTLNTLNSMMEKPEGEYCGWRLKVKYQTVDDSNTPYISEAWFIFDKDQKHILNSFDICLL